MSSNKKFLWAKDETTLNDSMMTKHLDVNKEAVGGMLLVKKMWIPLI